MRDVTTHNTAVTSLIGRGNRTKTRYEKKNARGNILSGENNGRRKEIRKAGYDTGKC